MATCCQLYSFYYYSGQLSKQVISESTRLIFIKFLELLEGLINPVVQKLNYSNLEAKYCEV